MFLFQSAEFAIILINLQESETRDQHSLLTTADIFTNVNLLTSYLLIPDTQIKTCKPLNLQLKSFKQTINMSHREV